MQTMGIIGLCDENIGQELRSLSDNRQSTNEPTRSDTSLKDISARGARIQANRQIALIRRYVQIGRSQPTFRPLHANRVYEVDEAKRLVASVSVLDGLFIGREFVIDEVIAIRVVCRGRGRIIVVVVVDIGC